MANSAAAESCPCPSLALTALTSVLAVLHLCRAEEVRGDMKVRLARAAVTRRKVSSPPFRRERPEKIVILFIYFSRHLLYVQDWFKPRENFEENEYAGCK